MVLRRKCACGASKSGEAECEECKKKKLQRKAAGGTGPAIAPPSVHEVLRSPGQPLDRDARSFFEPRFGHDFSKVRVHADEKAIQSAHDVNALAYTVGNNVVFGNSRISPRTNAGRQLLAHELAHVVQQSGTVATSDYLEIGATDHPAEYEAESAAHRALRQTESDGSPIARDPEPQLRRQGPGDDEPEKEPKPLIPLPHPLDRLDIKPTLPLPGGLDLPSTEDVNKGLYKIFGPKDKPKDLTCPPGWVKMADGRCCAGKPGVIDLTKCCEPSQLTILGTCCPEGVDDNRMNCVKRPPAPPAPPKKPEGKAEFSLTLPPMAPLTLDFPIHFKQNQPAATVTDETKLRSSLTPQGQGELDTVISWLQRGAEFSTQLTGMASVEGPTAHNQKLGEYRARSVANALMLRGISVLRISDPQGSADDCATLSTGIHNCGDSHASPAIDPNDRQVRARMFIPQKPTVISTKGQ